MTCHRCGHELPATGLRVRWHEFWCRRGGAFAERIVMAALIVWAAAWIATTSALWIVYTHSP